jgi:hypothetical protein
MVRGEKERIISEISDLNASVVFSDENLAEIKISEKRQEQFLDLLHEINAHHISTPLDEDFHSLNQFVVKPDSPRGVFDNLENNTSTQGGDGLLELQSMMYRAENEKSPSEVALTDLDRAEADLLEIKSDPDTDDDLLVQVEAGLQKIKKTKKEVSESFKELDERSKQGPLTQQAAEHIGIGPVQLNNIEPPNVIEKVWDKVGSHYAPGVDSIDDFLHQTNSYNAVAVQTMPEVVLRANGIYNLLNFFGYQRDEKMQKLSRMRASFSDMTHVGYALPCDYFYCFDQRMKYKAAAIYAYIGHGPEIKS